MKLEDSPCRTAKSALNALELVSTEGFDVVIIYYKLPDMTGSQLAEEIRGVEPSVRIILLSGRPRLPVGKLANVDDHIVSRSLLDAAIKIICDLLQSPNLTPELRDPRLHLMNRIRTSE